MKRMPIGTGPYKSVLDIEERLCKIVSGENENLPNNQIFIKLFAYLTYLM